MKRHLAALLLAAAAPLCVAESTTPSPVKLTIDATRVKGPMTPIWAWFGYDEPNYTTAPDGKKLLTGAPLDFVAFHAKGTPKVVDGIVRMGMDAHFRHLDDGFALVENTRN